MHCPLLRRVNILPSCLTMQQHCAKTRLRSTDIRILQQVQEHQMIKLLRLPTYYNKIILTHLTVDRSHTTKCGSDGWNFKTEGCEFNFSFKISTSNLGFEEVVTDQDAGPIEDDFLLLLLSLTALSCIIILRSLAVVSNRGLLLLLLSQGKDTAVDSNTRSVLFLK